MDGLLLKDLKKSFYIDNVIFIWWMNIACESMWNLAGAQVLPSLNNKRSAGVINRTEQLCLLLADEKDIVIQREMPSDIICENLTNIGIKIPNILIPEISNITKQESISEIILNDNKLIEKIRSLNKQINQKVILIPYAVTSLEEEISLRTGCELFGASSEITSWVNSKINSRLLAEELDLPVTYGYICHTIDDTESAIRKLKSIPTTKKIVIKEAYGASGKGFYIIDSEKSLQYILNVLERENNKDKRVSLIIEKWYDTRFDINYQLFIDREGSIHYIQPKKQYVKNGIYSGSEFFGENESKEIFEYFKKCAFRIGKKLWEKGYSGIASIDAIVTEDEGIFPIIEINGRFTLSTYISFIHEKVGKEAFVKSRYFSINPSVTIKEIWLKINKYCFISGKKYGVIIYSFAGGDSGFISGRLFILFIAYNTDDLLILENTIEELIYSM